MKLFLSFFFLLAGSAVFSQKTDFSGTWIFKDQQSISGKMYSNGVPKQIKVSQTPASFMREKITSTGTSDVTTADTVSFGKPTETVTASKRKKVTTIKWSGDDKSFTETAELYSTADATKMDFKITDEWSIGDDGTLTMIRKNENFMNGEVWQSKAVYEKQ